MFNASKKRQLTVAALLMLMAGGSAMAQSPTKSNFTISGKAFEQQNGRLVPLRQATIVLKEFGLVASSDADGSFQLKDVPAGTANISASYIGKLDIDTALSIQKNLDIQLVFQENSYRIDQVDVVAKKSDDAVGTSSKISSNAIEHLQANSLADMMSLLPGGLTQNPDLNSAKEINIRGIADETSASNAFGTSIIVNGSPVSNNANLQTLSPTLNGSGASLSGGASPAGGFDVRNIPVQNIESVEVIRGIPSVAYGDATSGAVIVNQKAGRQPLTVEARTNPNLYSLSASQGIVLSDTKGALNLGANYAYNTVDPVQSYKFYQRATFNTLYSNQFFNNKWSSNTGLNFNFGKDTRKLNPDDEITKTKSHGKEVGFALHTNGRYGVENRWLKNIVYAARVSYTDKASYLQEQHTSANAPYSMSYTDGAVLSNFPGTSFFDNEGNEITHIPAGEESLYAVYLPSTYVGEYNIYGKELNAFGQISALFYNRIGNTSSNWRIGADYKVDKNYGDGKVFADSLPPYRSAVYDNATFRKRKFSDIPALQQLGFFVEEDFTAQIAGRKLNIIAGARFDLFNKDLAVISPRFNASYEIIPNVLRIKGGYGLLSKAPSLLYVNPERAYFEYINVNELATNAIPADQRVFITTTRVFNTENEDLKIAQNKKAELGFDLNIGQSVLSVTAFQESLKNGYEYSLTARPVDFIEYKRVNNSEPIYTTTSNPVLAKFNTPSNSARLDKKGIEFDLLLKRIESIRTQFSINGMYIEQKSYGTNYSFYDEQSGTGAAARTHIALYDPEMIVEHDKSAVTSLRAVHNIPSIGFVVSLTTEFIWNRSDWTVYGNDSIPVKYISKIDGNIYDFDADRRDEAEFKTLLRPVDRTLEMVESLPPMVNFNINVTKDIKDFLRVSFFANNMFRSYPIAQSDRVKSKYYNENIPFYFGLNLALKIK